MGVHRYCGTGRGHRGGVSKTNLFLTRVFLSAKGTGVGYLPICIPLHVGHWGLKCLGYTRNRSPSDVAPEGNPYGWVYHCNDSLLAVFGALKVGFDPESSYRSRIGELFAP